MKKALLPLLLAAGLLLSVPARAANDSMENFARTRQYTGQFSDLTADSVFYDNVSALYAYGLSNGRSDGTYGLQAPVTRGEIFIFAGRIRSLYRTGDPEAGPGGFGSGESPLSAKYLGYLKSEQVVGNEVSSQFSELSRPATRAQVAHVLAHVLPTREMPLINEETVNRGYESGRFLTDVTRTTLYERDILLLYQAGISAGSDGTGTFHPDAPITRGAAAAMLTRLVDPSLRIRLDWDVSGGQEAEPQIAPPADTGSTVSGEITYGDLVKPGRYVAAPATGAELDETVRSMLAANSNQLVLRYPGISVVQVRSLMDAVLKVVKVYCEQSYNSVGCTFDSQGRITMTFTAASAGEDQIASYRETSLAAAQAVQRELWAEGTLREDMTELEKAEVYFTWICGNCVYDTTAGDSSLSHIPYSLFTNGTAVCDGYTGAYNLLLKLEGIECMALSNENHIWTVAELDGRLVHIDTTWGDAGEKPDYQFFAMSPEQSWMQHKW